MLLCGIIVVFTIFVPSGTWRGIMFFFIGSIILSLYSLYSKMSTEDYLMWFALLVFFSFILG